MTLFFGNPRIVLLIIGGWVSYGVFFAIQSYFSGRYLGRDISFTQTLTRWLICAFIWLVITPMVYKLARDYPYEKGRVFQRLIIHLTAGGLTSFCVLTLFFAIWQVVKGGTAYRFEVAEWQRLLVSEFHVYTLLYFILIGLYYVYDYYWRFKEHQRRAFQLELETAQLEKQLAHAQLNALRMQIHPHFLFNTLNSISVLMRDDPTAANQMLLRLSELLRVALKTGASQVIPLREELEFLRGYLAIEQTRFQDRLTVTFRIEEQTLDAKVPNLILQPLVENAIRHGIAPRARAGGVIEIRAARNNGYVEISVTDNGSGTLAPESSQGIGLKNTKERLQRFYGDHQSFEFVRNETGGVRVRLRLPYVSDELQQDTNPDRR